MRTTTLGELVDEAGGIVQTGPFGSQLHAHDYSNSGVAVVMPQNIRNGRLDHSSIAHVTTGRASGLSRHTLQAGDIVYSRRGDVEKCALVLETDLPAMCGTGSLLVRVPKSHFADSTFLAYLLQTDEVRKWVRGHAVGATMLNLNTQILREVPLVLPPLPKQQAIAEVLGALDDKIAANRALVATADALARAFTNECLADSTTTQLCDLATITMGSSPKGTSYNESGEGVVLYQGMKDFGIRSPLPRVWTTEPGRLAHAGDILMSVRAPVGTLNRATEECCIGRGLASLTAHQPNALFHLLLGQQTLFAPFNGDGTIFGSINKRQLHALPVRIPSAGLTELEAKTAPLEAQVASALSESATLAALRDTLLPALMDGTLRVKDAERTVSEAL